MIRPFSNFVPVQGSTVSAPGVFQSVSWNRPPGPPLVSVSNSSIGLQLHGTYVISAALRVEGAVGVTGFRSKIRFPRGDTSFWDPGALAAGEYRTLRLSCIFQYLDSRGGVSVEFTSDGGNGVLIGPDSNLSIAFLG
jgi:hypothetical protein